jgi:hypothetical protein
MKCLLCAAGSSFRSEEHIVPESLGNDLLVLAPGWVCDGCNNLCSSFESRALSRSILGFERCRRGVITKKGRPARASIAGVEFLAEPTSAVNVVAAEAHWSRVPVLSSPGGTATVAFLVHDDSNADICRLLLKIGIELAGIVQQARGPAMDLGAARAALLGRDAEPWPYFLLLASVPPPSLVSVLHETPEAHEYVVGLGLDLFLHEMGSEVVLVFQYGAFLSAIAITSRATARTEGLRDWKIPFVGCPVEFAGVHG